MNQESALSIGTFGDHQSHMPYHLSEDGRLHAAEITFHSKDGDFFTITMGKPYEVLYQEKPLPSQHGNISYASGIASIDAKGHFVLLNPTVIYVEMTSPRSDIIRTFTMDYIEGMQINDEKGNQIFELPIAVLLPVASEIRIDRESE